MLAWRCGGSIDLRCESREGLLIERNISSPLTLMPWVMTDRSRKLLYEQCFGIPDNHRIRIYFIHIQRMKSVHQNEDGVQPDHTLKSTCTRARPCVFVSYDLLPGYCLSLISRLINDDAQSLAAEEQNPATEQLNQTFSPLCLRLLAEQLLSIIHRDHSRQNARPSCNSRIRRAHNLHFPPR